MRLKALRSKKKILQKELSRNLGVSQTTISNYEKGIRFPDEETLKKLACYFNVSLDELFGYEPRSSLPIKVDDHKITHIDSPLALTPLAERYMQYLLKGEKRNAHVLICNAIKAGENVQSIYMNVFERILLEFGGGWEKNTIDIAKEHFVHEATRDIMASVAMMMPLSKKKNETLISLAISGDLHNFGIKIVTDFMEMDGWNTFFLGTDVPSQSLIKAIEAYKADLVLISATMDYNVNNVANLIQIIHSSYLTKKPKIMVGGLAFNHDKMLWQKIKADGYSCNATECVVIANRLISERVK